MKIFISLLLFLHGAIHVLGFVSAWQLAPVPQLSGRTLIALPGPLLRGVGVLWLLAALVLLGAAALRFFGAQSWWIVAAVGVALSQGLIVLQWHDAWAGTIANALILAAVLGSAAAARFSHQIDGEARALLARAAVLPRGPAVQPADLAPLPAPVRRWLEVSGVVGRPRAGTIRLKQRGEMRTAPDKPFMPAVAEQYFSIDEPGFIWRVDVRMMGLPVAGRDRYVDGKGGMLIKIASALPIVDASGDKIDQGTLLRFLGEIVWFPSAALRPYLTWEPIDERHARATMRHRGVSASAIFAFDEKGRFASLSADRYLGAGADARLERWFIAATQWRTFDGIEVPSRCEVTWRLQGGDFTYYRLEITDLEADRPSLYPR